MPVYAVGLAVKNAAHARGWVRTRQLRAPVISVGNLSVGGAGKTPLVIRLAEVLAARGFAVDVLSRGYGRRSGDVARVVLDGEPDGAGRFGDEPLLIARASGVPVYVGASRYKAGMVAEQLGGRVHLLDDGFQHRQLARAVDIVVLHRSDFRAGLLPAGRLREPLKVLRRASVAVLRVEDADLEAEVRRVAGGLPVWRVARELVVPEGPGPAVAFCGIAHPEEFFRGLAGAEISLGATHAFRDHHVYTDADVRVIVRSVQATGARRLLTTEKDLVRLSGAHRVLLEQAAALVTAPLRARLVHEDARVTEMLALAGLPGSAQGR